MLDMFVCMREKTLDDPFSAFRQYLGFQFFQRQLLVLLSQVFRFKFRVVLDRIEEPLTLKSWIQCQGATDDTDDRRLKNNLHESAKSVEKFCLSRK